MFKKNFFLAVLGVIGFKACKKRTHDPNNFISHISTWIRYQKTQMLRRVQYSYIKNLSKSSRKKRLQATTFKNLNRSFKNKCFYHFCDDDCRYLRVNVEFAFSDPKSAYKFAFLLPILISLK